MQQVLYLVKIEVVIEWNNQSQLGPGPEPSYGIPADGEEDDGHVEFEGLGGALGGGDTIAHDMKDGTMTVLDKFPGEEAGADGEPEGDHPDSLPIVLHEVGESLTAAAEGVVVLGGYQLLAKEPAEVGAVGC